MRYRKRKKAASQVMGMTVVVLAVLATLMVLTCSQVFKVRSVLVVGNRNISKEDIIALSGVREGDNLFSLSDTELKKRLEQNWYIEYIGHEFDYRGTLTLHINERMGMGVVNAFRPVFCRGCVGHGARMRGQRLSGHGCRAADHQSGLDR